MPRVQFDAQKLRNKPIINHFQAQFTKPLDQEQIIENQQIQQQVQQGQINYEYLQNMNLKRLISELKKHGCINQNKLLPLLKICQNILKNQPNVLKITSPLTIVGDIHGQFFDLIKIFQTNGYPEANKFLFLGDYVDRGLFCIEVITLLLVLKVKFPKNTLLLRGNHEGRIMTTNFNFKIQCQKKYRIQIYERFLELFNKLPICAVVDNTYFAVHGGISPEISVIKQIQKINRFTEIQNKGVLCDLMWSDPSEGSIGQWEPNSMRGCSYFYSKIQTKRFLKQNKLKMIIRGHQVQIEGFSYQKTNMDQKLTLTIFSAPNYCDTYKNKGAIALIAKNTISLKKFSQTNHPFVLANYMDCFEFSMPGVCQLVGKIFLYLLKSNKKSKKSSLLDERLIQELNALQRIQVINQIIQKKQEQHDQVLLQKVQIQEQNKIEEELMNKSLQLAFKIFAEKKFNDTEEKYPNQLQRTRGKTHLRKNQSQIFLNSKASNNNNVFGPKISMKNNICKKSSLAQEDDLITNLASDD